MRKAFTLVELLVVLIILGVLTSLILPNALRAIQQANVRVCATNIRNVDTACQMCFSETRRWVDCDTMQEVRAFFPDEDGDGVGDTPICPLTNGTYAVVQDAASGGYRADRTGHFSAAGSWPDSHD